MNSLRARRFSRRRVRPPELIDAGLVHLRRQTPDDAAAVARAVLESLDHLRPWMPWADESAGTEAFQATRLVDVSHHWDAGTDFVYSLVVPGQEDAVAGIIGLHSRIGPGGIEMGYWTHVDHTGRGYMSAAAAALTPVAAGLVGIERVEIHTDEANQRSAAIPRKLGYRLDRVDTREPQAPAESGRLQIWIRP